MRYFERFIAYSALVIVLAGASYLVYTQAAPYFEKPCEKPITYSLGEFDERFGISRASFSAALEKAAQIWNTAAGKQVIAIATPEAKDAVVVSLSYGTEQKTAELGKTIDSEQVAYDRKKAAVESLKSEFETARATYESRAALYDRKAAQFHSDVSYWNTKGGAPPDEYEKLQDTQKDLETEQKRLQDSAEVLNTLASDINRTVDELNALVKKLNTKVSTYNARAGEDFDQGNYVEDEKGSRITINEFKSRAELERVLTHEFGHALGIGHVENPESIMYSYNIGTDLVLSEEDIAALRGACELDS
ncbi:MAG: matrixin family metalloprotease [Minisyncoccia bacterium]